VKSVPLRDEHWWVQELEALGMSFDIGMGLELVVGSFDEILRLIAGHVADRTIQRKGPAPQDRVAKRRYAKRTRRVWRFKGTMRRIALPWAQDSNPHSR
jgi:hypothetical protein